jgi:DNA-binding MarR family transcriptional regulator
VSPQQYSATISEMSQQPTVSSDKADQPAEAEKPRFSYAAATLERSIRRRLGEVLQPFGLTVAEYTSLSLIRRRDGYSNANLARRSFVSPQAMHEMISSLEARDLLERAPSASHRSVRHTHLTEKGRELLARCDAAVDEMEEVMLVNIPQTKRAEVTSLLMQCARNLSEPLPPD